MGSDQRGTSRKLLSCLGPCRITMTVKSSYCTEFLSPEFSYLVNIRIHFFFGSNGPVHFLDPVQEYERGQDFACFGELLINLE